VLGALAAIPVAGTLQILLVDWRTHRGARRDAEPRYARAGAEAASGAERV
jgi:hypothetical protein